jgi:hypothetical protein
VFSGKARGDETRLSRRPTLAALVASNPRDQTTFTLLGRSFRSELQLSRLGRRTDDICSAQELSKRKSLTKGHNICQDVGQITIRPLEVM